MERGELVNLQPRLLRVIGFAISVPLSLTLSPQAGRGDKTNFIRDGNSRLTRMARRPYRASRPEIDYSPGVAGSGTARYIWLLKFVALGSMNSIMPLTT